MKKMCRNCGSEDVIEKDGKLYCQCCGQVFDVAKQQETEVQNLATAPSVKFDKMFKQVVSIQSIVGETVKVGTAFFINSKFALTNAHVLFENDTKASKIIGKNYAGDKTFDFELIDYDMELDIALIESKNISNFTYAVLTERVENGETVYAIGNSKGEGLCVVNGLVSDKNRLVSGIPYIMCSALVTNGNSGGPLYDDRGFVVGMISMSTPDVVSMNYALPSKAMNEFLKRTKI